MTLLQLVILALLVESLWETFKMVWQEGKLSIDRIGSLVLGLVIAIGAQADILNLLGISSIIPYLGIVLSGILISRGASFIHDLLSGIGKITSNNT